AAFFRLILLLPDLWTRTVPPASLPSMSSLSRRAWCFSASVCSACLVVLAMPGVVTIRCQSFRQFGVSRLCRLAAPGMMKMELGFGSLWLEAGVGSEADDQLEPRARVSVWPGRPNVPGIVAPEPWGARGAECLLAYVWGGGPLRARDTCGDLAYFPRFFERPPAFFPENRSDNIS